MAINQDDYLMDMIQWFMMRILMYISFIRLARRSVRSSLKIQLGTNSSLFKASLHHLSLNNNIVMHKFPTENSTLSGCYYNL